MRWIINWRIFFILLTMSLLSVLAVLPYVLSLQGELLRQAGISLGVLIPLQLLQTVILFSMAIFVGLYLVPKIHFQLPLLEAWVGHKDYKKIFNDILFVSVGLGMMTAVTIYVTDLLFSRLGSAISTSQELVPIWQKLLASFYGGITEEILLRLFLMTLLIFLGMKVRRQSRPSQMVIIVSIFLAAILFGLGHLPITASLTRLTPMIISRAIVLNGIGGIVFGLLYWKKGLESAMIAHFTADIFLLTILPGLF